MNYDKILKKETERLQIKTDIATLAKEKKCDVIKSMLSEFAEFFEYLNKTYRFQKGYYKFMVTDGYDEFDMAKEMKRTVMEVGGVGLRIMGVEFKLKVDVEFNLIMTYGYDEKNSDGKVYKTSEAVIEKVMKDIASRLHRVENGSTYASDNIFEKK